VVNDLDSQLNQRNVKKKLKRVRGAVAGEGCSDLVASELVVVSRLVMESRLGLADLLWAAGLVEQACCGQQAWLSRFVVESRLS
jgi:hypothetical protein